MLVVDDEKRTRLRTYGVPRPINIGRPAEIRSSADHFWEHTAWCL